MARLARPSAESLLSVSKIGGVSSFCYTGGAAAHVHWCDDMRYCARAANAVRCSVTDPRCSDARTRISSTTVDPLSELRGPTGPKTTHRT